MDGALFEQILPPAAVEGDWYEWRIFIEEARSLFRRARGAQAEAEAVMRAILRCLEAEGVSAAFE